MTTEELTARRQGGGGNGRLVLYVGLALGIVAAVLVAIILSGSDDGGEKIVPATRVAVVARQDIPERTRITRDMIEVKTYNVGDIDSDAFTTVGQVTNRVTAARVATGEPLTPSVVSNTTGEGLTFSVSQGMRAVSISVQEVVTAGGNLSPDNRVDIVGVFRIPQGADVNSIIQVMTGQRPLAPLTAPQNASVTFTILQNVRVLAVAQDLSADARKPSGSSSQNDASFDFEAAEANPRAATVTLEVTPQQAQVMAIADLHGTLRLSLRPFGEDDIVDVIPIVVLLED